MIYADRRVSLHEFVVLTLVRSQLGRRDKPGADRQQQARRTAGWSATLVLSLIAHAGVRQDATGERGEAVPAAMRAGAREMAFGGGAGAGADAGSRGRGAGSR